MSIYMKRHNVYTITKNASKYTKCHNIWSQYPAISLNSCWYSSHYTKASAQTFNVNAKVKVANSLCTHNVMTYAATIATIFTHTLNNTQRNNISF